MTPPFFYGWIIVAISMIAGFFAAGVSNITMAVVLKPISDDLDWSRAHTSERLHPRRVSVATMLISGAAVALLLQATDPFTMYLFAVIFGLTARGAAVLIPVLLARYFGRRSFGAISSILDPFHKSGLGLGPFLAGMAFDFTDSYRVIFFDLPGQLFDFWLADISGLASAGRGNDWRCQTPRCRRQVMRRKALSEIDRCVKRSKA